MGLFLVLLLPTGISCILVWYCCFKLIEITDEMEKTLKKLGEGPKTKAPRLSFGVFGLWFDEIKNEYRELETCDTALVRAYSLWIRLWYSFGALAVLIGLLTICFFPHN